MATHTSREVRGKRDQPGETKMRREERKDSEIQVYLHDLKRPRKKEKIKKKKKKLGPLCPWTRITTSK